jgi:hypothetical protein
MKKRIIVCVLVIVLGLTGCGSPETAEAVVTSAETTAKTFEASTAAETTTEATIATTKSVMTTNEPTTTTAPTTTTPPESIPDTPFKDIEFTADYRSANNAALENAENFSYTADGVTVYIEGDKELLYVKIANSDDEPIYIDNYVKHVIFANGEITYTDGYDGIKVYDLKKGELTLDYSCPASRISAFIRNKDKIVYLNADYFPFVQTNTTDLIVIDVNTLEEEYIYSTSFWYGLEETDEHYYEQTQITAAFNFDVDGMLYFAVMTGQESGGFHKRIIYRYDLETKKTQEVLTETSETPFSRYLPDAAIISEDTLKNIIIEKTGCDEIRSFSCDGNRFIYTYYSGAINRQEIWGIDGENFYKAPISGVGIDLTIDENEDITLMAVAADNFTMGDDINGANTWKPYYFYYDNGFKEYGGSEISLEEFLTYENAKSYIDEIENLNGEITNILKRGNDIININYRVPDPERNLKWNYYYTLKIADSKATHINNSTNDEGVYLPALLPEIAVYSGVLYPVFNDGSYDYIYKTGKVVIDGNFETAEFFSEGLGVVSKDGKYGAVNTNGDIVIPFEYKIIGEFNDSAAYIVDENDKFGYVDNTGEIFIDINYPVIKDPYVRINNFSEGLCIIQTSPDECICIDKTGSVIWEGRFPLYDSGDRMYHNGLLLTLYDYVDTTGEIAFETFSRGDFTGNYPSDFSEGFAVYKVPTDPDLDFTNGSSAASDYWDDSKWAYVYLNTSGNNEFGEFYDNAADFSEGIAIVEKNDIYYAIDKTGKVIFDNSANKFDINSYFSDGYMEYFIEKDDGKKLFGFIDRNGEIALPAVYDDVVRGFDNGLALIELDGELVYINKQGEKIYEFNKPDEVIW